MGTPFNFLEYPTDLVIQVAFWRLRFALSLRDIVELCQSFRVQATMKETINLAKHHQHFQQSVTTFQQILG